MEWCTVEPLYSRHPLSGTPPYNGHFFRERVDQKPHRKSLLRGHLLIANTSSGSRWCPL